MAKRGRNYPAFGLPEAIERARKLFQQEGRAQTSPEVAVGAWGYSSLNGASLRVLAALRQYGLLEGAGDAVKLTQRALTILLEPPESKERAQAIAEAALEPDIFADLLGEYATELPSDATLVSYLVRKQGFQEQPAQSLVEALRQTIALVKESPVPHFAEDKAGTSAAGVATGVSLAQATAETRRPAATGGHTMAFNWPLGDNQVVTVAFTRAPNQDDITTLEAYLEIAKKKLPPVELPMSGGSMVMGEP